jgi:immune inhibitor A
VDVLDALHLTSETNGGRTFDVPARPSVPVFDDSDVNGYWDGTDARSSLYSVQVAGVGSMIQVLSSDESSGAMVVKAGKRFVAVTQAVAISGTPSVGQTLSAVAPTFFQSGVAVTYQWLVAGQPVPGATGATYQVRPSDAGKPITVRATGTLAGYDAGTSVSAPAGAQAARTVVSVDAPRKVGRDHRAKVRVTVTDAGAVPTGRVEITHKGKVLVSETLRNGRATLRLPKLSRAGVKELVVSYLPDAGFQAASTTVRIRVKHRR